MEIISAKNVLYVHTSIERATTRVEDTHGLMHHTAFCTNILSDWMIFIGNSATARKGKEKK